MLKRTLYIIIPILLLVSLSIYLFVFRSSNTTDTTNNALKAIPISSPIFIKINKPIKSLEEILNSEILKTAQSITHLNIFFEKINQIKNFISEDEKHVKLVKGNEIIITLNYSGKDVFTTMVLIALQTKNDIEIISQIINKLKQNPDINIETRKYNKANINKITSGTSTFFQTIYKGVLVISEKALLVEDAIIQLDMESIETNLELQPLLKTVGNQADFNIFVNYKQADRIFSKISSQQLKNKISLFKSFTGWSEFDIKLDDEKVLLSGFSSGNNQENYFANILQNQQAVNSNIEKILPHSTSYFLSLNLSDINGYFKDYQEFLVKQNQFLPRENKLSKIEKETTIEIIEVIADLIKNETAIAGISVDQSNAKSGRIWIIETKSGSSALTKMLELQNNYIEMKELNKSEWYKNYQIDKQSKFPIYKFPYPNLPGTLFGQIYSEVEANWFTIYDNYLIFGDSFRTVSKALHSNVLGETLSDNYEYDKFKSNLNARSNINFYCNTSISLPIAELAFNQQISKSISENDELRKFKSFAWQITSTGEMLYNNSCLLYSEIIKSKPQTIWQSHMNAAFDFKPTFVINHNDKKNKEIVLQDNENNFYLINNIGRSLWNIKLESQIIGDIQQIDYYKNGKLQYLFNTENKIYLVDRNGNNIKNFPIVLRTKATNGVSIFDYDNNRDYRFFVVGDDQIIYAYNKEANLLKGWNLFKTDHIVNHPIQHFRVEGKDYIVATDKMKDYILNRKGTIRVKSNEVYPHSVNNTAHLEERTTNHDPRIVTTEKNGNIHYTYFDSKHEVVENNKFTENHFFEVANIDNDPGSEYIFTDGKQLIILNSNGKIRLKKNFDNLISHKPNIYRFSQNSIKVGITCKSSNKIYLIDIDGSFHQGFPLDGCTEFSIGFISNDSNNFNLLTGSPDGYLYNYYVE